MQNVYQKTSDRKEDKIKVYSEEIVCESRLGKTVQCEL
jgi:hypothetical protein